MTTQVQDDGFHEIQLNGKQLVFLFMAATVVSVVIFLCGVLVGRGVKAERGVPAQSETSATTEITDPPPSAASAPVQAANNDPSATTPPPVPAEGKLSYTDLLENSYKNKKESPKAPAVPERRIADVQPPATPPVVPATKPAAVAPKELPAPKETVAPAPPAASHGDGYAIQVAALRESGEADTIAKRLVSKGYDAYVLTPPGGTPNVYRVRVGSFKTRRDAEAVASKLQLEEQFKPWITR